MGTPAPSGKPSPLEEVGSELSPAVPESVLILRIARDLILPLHFASDADQPSPQIPVRTIGDTALAVPFRISKRLTDPETGQNFLVALAIEPSVVPDRVRLALGCDPIPHRGTCKASLREAERNEELVRIPILQRWESLDTELPFGFYIVDVSRDEHSLCRFTFIVEPFSLPEALEAAQEYVAHSQYGRAVAILEDAGARYPNNAEVWDLLSVVEELVALDPEAVQREEKEFGIFRGPLDRFKGAGTVLQKMRSKFGESIASLLVGRKLEPASVPDTLLSGVQNLPVSSSVLRALVIMEKCLQQAGEGARRRDERLEQAVIGVTARLGQLEKLTLDLDERIGAIRADQDREVEDKYAAISEVLIRFLDDIRTAGISLPDFTPFFQEKLGEACWRWIGDETQRMFVTAEDIYRYFSGSSTAQTRDFTPALLEFCRSLELLLNFRLGTLCEAVRRLIKSNRQLQEFVDKKIGWAKLDETIKSKKSYTIPQVAISLRLGNAIAERYPELIGKDVTASLTSSGLSDHESISVLSHIGQIFRNGKVHPYPGSKRMFTPPPEVLILRKLLLGFDEERVDSGAFFAEFYKLQGFTKGEINTAANSVFQKWSQFPGLVPKIWTAERAGLLQKAS